MQVSPWKGSLMMSRSRKSLVRNISTSSAVRGPPMFSISTPVLAAAPPAEAVAVVANCRRCHWQPRWRAAQVRVAATVDERAGKGENRQ